MSAASHIAIVGAGHAGGRVAQHLKSLGHTGRLTLIGAESHAPYERPALSKELLLGKSEQQSIRLAPADFWHDDALTRAGIERMHATADSLDLAARRLHLRDGRSVDFDLLVVATGGAPRLPPFMQAPLEGVHVLRTLDDCLGLRASLTGCRRLAILGAGVIGMEVASSALSLDVPVTVLEGGAGVMTRCLPPSVAAWLAAQHVARGVDLRTGVSVTGIERDKASGAAVLPLHIHFEKDGVAATLDADCVLVAIGVDCNPAFLHGTGLSDARGIIVDEWCRSPAASWLYAAGDAACTFDSSANRHLRQETWRNAENQARAVAEIMLGRTEPYRETPWMWTDQLGHAIQVTGIADAGDQTVVRGDLDAANATVLSLRDGCVSAGVTINQSRERRHVEKLVSSRKPVDATRLADPAVALKELV
ncbi:p-cumate 2,3-dioxygenase system, ferredoxin--NAD(+) reductase component [Paraburkholderia ultramafica]|uniref:p-cumate 2,3-dioxygenase system, ferredoxin--NAD(+) reductase component n=1 Tax=Paraburkholderia ultramafica TaxID=1544867 RepID=A0A6S7D4E3_9BURK|nr:FAD-dependent oxidoreductase [Paraburkholderia ultramafica]CAB3806324.1 p-cumate 2,3-dioxygenase system, ferredoxin--NAD(+) reductase component [Paraburkholderia ultramafica]